MNHPNRNRHNKLADWQPGDRVFWENEPSLCGTVMNPPPNPKLRRRGWVWVLWDSIDQDPEMEHCPSYRLISRAGRAPMWGRCAR